MVDLYDGEIAQADENLAALFAAIRKLGLEKTPLSYLRRNTGTCSANTDDSCAAAPTRHVLRPGVEYPVSRQTSEHKKIVRTDALAQTVDFLPTLLEMLGLADADAELRQGKSVLPALREKNAEEVNEYVYAGSLYKAVNNEFFSGESVVEMVRNKEWKLIKEIIYAENPERKFQKHTNSTMLRTTRKKYKTSTRKETISRNLFSKNLPNGKKSEALTVCYRFWRLKFL